MGKLITATEAVTPSAPSPGYLKIYPKTDNNYYTLDSNGVERMLGGLSLQDSGSRASPLTITSAITPTAALSNRIFIIGSPTTNPTISNTSGNLFVYLFGTDDTNTVTIASAGNFQLSGTWVGRNGSMLLLMWDGLSKYVEVSRNEI